MGRASLFPFVRTFGLDRVTVPSGWTVKEDGGNGATDRRIWPCGRYEVYLEDERLNGFHSLSDAQECVEAFDGAVLLDRADRFSW